MPRQPARFENVAKLTAHLASTEVHTQANDFLHRSSWPFEDVVRRAVDSTTYRAFSLKRWGARPSVLYQTWVREYLGQHRPDFLRAPDDAAYQGAIDGAVASLQERWRNVTRGNDEIGYGRAAKLLNLTLKHLMLLDSLSSEERYILQRKLHVALDRFTLAPIAKLAPNMRLGRTPSMGSVRTREQYIALQRWIADVCADAGVPPIYYEAATFDAYRLVAQQDAPRPSDGAPPRPAPGASRRRASVSRAPHTDPCAEVVRRREVIDAVVIHVEEATYRDAKFKGVIEIVDAGVLTMPGAEHAGRRVEGKLSWYGWRPKTRFPAIELSGAWRIEHGYSGEVIDMLARPEFLAQKHK